MTPIECRELIISRLNVRGEGICGDPVRQVLTVYDKDGTYIAEHDPIAIHRVFAKEEMVRFADACLRAAEFNPKTNAAELLETWIETHREKL